jgi:arylsulfatase A-like enzyme
VSTYHQRDVQTPHIDSLAAKGMLFENMRANCTVCSPSRAALLTGQYADRVGVPGVIRTHADNSWGYFKPGVPTLADQLQSAGYHTAIIGKWHLGLESPNTPNERGFTSFQGFLGDMMDNYQTHLRHGNNYMRRNREIITPEGHATDLFSDWAVDFLMEFAYKKDPPPFFLYLAYNAPHFPIEPPESWLQRVRERQPDLSESRAKNVAFVEHLDDGIGRVLHALRKTGLDQTTLVIFTSDNGGSLPHGQSNHPWRDGKQSHYDGGLRVPFIAAYPPLIEAGSQSRYAGLNFDIFPTCLELAGVKLPPGLDAVSLVPAFSGQQIDQPRELYFVRREGGNMYGGKSYHAIIRGDWKLLQNSPFRSWELYNLRQDPMETHDLADQNPTVVAELATAIRQHIQIAGSTPWQKADPAHE